MYYEGKSKEHVFFYEVYTLILFGLVLSNFCRWRDPSPGDELEDFVEYHYRHGNPKNGLPFVCIQRYYRKQLREEWHIQNHEMQCHGQNNR